MNGKLLERCFVNLVCSFVGKEPENGFCFPQSHADFAKKAFASSSSPIKTWQAIRLGQRGKARNVSIEESYQMAEAINEKVDRLMIKAESLIQLGWTLEQDVFNSLEAKQAGRPIGKTKKRDQKAPESTIITMPNSNDTRTEAL